MTFKQLEALFWVAQLGGFGPAAVRLHTAQSAISKRIQELESQLGVPLFDRSERASRLTPKGDELVGYAKRLLDLRDEAARQVGDLNVIAQTLRVGVTELSSMTWMPRLIGSVQARYPRVVVEPDIDSSVALRDKLMVDEIDLMIVPDAFPDPRLMAEPVGTLENAWMCKPGLVDDTRTMHLADLSRYPMLGNRSGPGLIYDRWFKELNFIPSRFLSANSIVALASMTVAGLGISYLPKASFQHLVTGGLLSLLDVTPALPVVTYVAMHKAHRQGVLMSSFIALAREHCNFSDLLLNAGRPV